MPILDTNRCIGCGLCVTSCALGVLTLKDGGLTIGDGCCLCNTCVRACPHNALSLGVPPVDAVTCQLCGVGCIIPAGGMGACRRFVNWSNTLQRNRPLCVPARERFDRSDLVLGQPLVTGVGAGSTSPDYVPAPYIVEEEIEGIDVVTVVTEAPILYSSLLIKVDTVAQIGWEGARVFRDRKAVGMVMPEQYGSQVLVVGGVQRISGKHGLSVVQTMAEIGNGERVVLKVQDGAELELQAGKPPVVNGQTEPRLPPGCGAACASMFAQCFAQMVDEAIVLGSGLTGLLTELPACSNLRPASGVAICGNRRSPGAYELEGGGGWGGTRVMDPAEVIAAIDSTVAQPGMRILVTEATGQHAALFEWDGSGSLNRIMLPAEVRALCALLADNCEEARTSIMYWADVGGSARGGVTVNPIALTRAVHSGDAILSIGGAPAHVLSGAGINLIANVEQMVPRPFTYVPVPALVVPIEYTIERSKYAAIGGHVESVRPLSEVLREQHSRAWLQTDG